MQLSLARVGVDLHLFEKLVASEKPLSLKDLTAELSADPQLLGMLPRLAIVAYMHSTLLMLVFRPSPSCQCGLRPDQGKLKG